MKVHRIALRVFCAVALVALGATSTRPVAHAMGKPGVTPVPCPSQEWQYSDPAFDPLTGAKAFFGRYDGGLYRLEIPEAWNGELVLFAHGYVPNTGAQGSTLRVQSHSIREHLVKGGFAWAASSYRCNGYVPGQGLVDTLALVDVFTKANDGRAPQRTYLTGVSMGGHVALLGMQEFPKSFAGGLAMCPAGPELFDYYAAVSAAAEVIAGVSFTRDGLQQDITKIGEIVGRPPDYTDKGRQLASVEIQISGGPRPFALEGLASRFLANMSTSAAALVGVDTPVNRALTNTHITYTIDEGLGLRADALNFAVRRKAADAAVRNPDGLYEEVVPFDGRIERPVLTMHGTGDLFVPVFLEQVLKKAVVAAGNERLLVQRLYRIGAHCQFSQPEQIRAFDDLVAWVRQGTKPAGDEVLGDLSDAGRTFTDALRPNDPGGKTVPAKSASAAPPVAAPASAAAASSPTPVRNGTIDFVRDVQPIFRQSCYGCHGAAVHQAGLRLDRRADAMRGGSGPLIGPGNSAGSRLYLRLRGQFGSQMPPTGALKAEQIAIVKDWIDQGAEWPDAASGETPPPPPDSRAVRAIEALRAGNLSPLKSLAASEPKLGGLRGDGGTTPLMYAVLHADASTVRLLLDGGADPNVANDVGATALMWAVTDLEKTRLLVDRGANVNAKSDDGLTPLLIAAGLPGGTPVVKLLVERSANVDADAPTSTTVFSAAFSGDEAALRLLLDAVHPPVKGTIGALAFALRRGCTACADAIVAKMDAKQIDETASLLMPPDGDTRVLTYLLEHGASPTRTDAEGHTLLMQAASSDVAAPALVASLIARGVDVNARCRDGHTALALARQRGHTPIVDLLRKAGAKDDPAPVAAHGAPEPAASPRDAIVRSVPLLQQSSGTFLKKSGCVSCHNNTLTSMAVALARGKGVRVDEDAADEQLQTVGRFIDTWRERALQGIGIPGEADTVSYILLGLSADNYPRTDATDALARFLLRHQSADGFWRILAHRPPIESSDVQVTAVSMRALQVYAPPSMRATTDRAIARAATWLTTAPVTTTEDRAFQLLGLGWSSTSSSASKRAIQKAGRALVATERADGGWSQLPTLESDAYATGQALVALEQSGALAPTDAAFQRGVRFLLSTQRGDGSWFVRTRALPIQPFFESGFPFGRDQFISAAATGWATMALALASR